MECKKCGNDEVENFDFGVDNKNSFYLVCLSCDERVPLTKEHEKELMKTGHYRK